jgi:rhomboid protease GluP
MIESLDKKNLLTMKLLHYLITNQNYNPIILQGADNEIWLENLNNEYKVVRIVSNHIINDEQLNYDIFKTKRIVRKIKHKTFSMSMKVLSFYIDLDEDIKLENMKNMDLVSITDESDIKNYKFVLESFPDMDKKLKFSEEGLQLFMKITGDINKKNRSDGEKVEEIFKPKKPYVTYAIIVINVIIYLLTLYFGDFVYTEFAVSGRMIIEYHQFYRIITGGFLHNGLLHLALNMYSLYIIGSQMEGFQGKVKYSITYIYSLMTGSMLSMILNNGTSVGASGAIFGLLGSMLAFGYYYRVYLGGVLKSQIIPIIIVNLLIGFLSGGVIDNYGHIGGLIGGILITVALGVKYKSTNFERINGAIVSALFVIGMLFIAFNFVNF